MVWSGRRVTDLLNSSIDARQSVQPMGSVKTGSGTATIRFLASRDTAFVRVHVQSDSTGGITFDGSTYISEEDVDCRESRQQDYALSSYTGFHYYAWLIPVLKDRAGNTIVYDGQSGNGPDHMAFVDVGAL